MHACNSVLQATARGFQHGRVGGAAVTLRDSEGEGLPRVKAGLGKPLPPELGSGRKGSRLRELPSSPFGLSSSPCLSGGFVVQRPGTKTSRWTCP